MTFNFDREFQSMMQVHDLNTVILLGHLNPDGDAAGSVMGLAHYIKVNYPQYKVMPYLADTLESLQKRSELLKRAERLLDGNVACVCINRAESEAEGISYEDIHPISGFLRDCEDI